ncbi:Histidine kinase-, DNA gyrase B-, and HSP90-like ATPase [Eubacterium ruminantium]|nr:Histidine kinase-, DNA gyrase B-, and HSP90-like ATPase [Eubacterium ruminantium]
MNTLTLILLIALIICLFILIGILIRYHLLRAEVRSFREQLNMIRTTDREQPLQVASFSASSVELAKEINLLTEELRKAATEATESEKRIRVIMAGVSHDFRTPLTSIDGYLQMIQGMLDECNIIKNRIEENTKTIVDIDENKYNELREYLDIVYDKVRYLKELSDEFFEVTYIQAKNNPEMKSVRFDTVLSEELLSSYNWINEKKLDIKIDIPDEKLTVQADEHYLKRIIENLFSNARKYSETFLVINVIKNSDYIKLNMKNDINSEMNIDTAHIFEPFVRSKDRSGPGTGLGLYICKELADYLGFSISGNVEKNIFTVELVMPVL